MADDSGYIKNATVQICGGDGKEGAPGLAFFTKPGIPETTATLHSLAFYHSLPQGIASYGLELLDEAAATWEYEGIVEEPDLTYDDGEPLPTTFESRPYEVHKFVFTGQTDGYTLKEKGHEHSWPGSVVEAVTTERSPLGYVPTRPPTIFHGHVASFSLASRPGKTYTFNLISAHKLAWMAD